MATWTIKGHNRGGGQRKSHYVKPYQQNRRDGKPRGKGSKPYTACQNDIAEVINRNLAFNATPEVLRAEHDWRYFVCHCKGSNVYDIATTGVAGANSWWKDNPVKGADFTFWNPSTKKWQTQKGTIANVKGFFATSTCAPIRVWVPAHRKPLTGKQVILLKAGA